MDSNREVLRKRLCCFSRAVYKMAEHLTFCKKEIAELLPKRTAKIQLDR